MRCLQCQGSPYFANIFATFERKQTRVRQVVLDEWLHRRLTTADPPSALGTTKVRESQGRGVWTSVNARVRTCKELRVKNDQTSCYLRPPFLGTPLVPSRRTTADPPSAWGTPRSRWRWRRACTGPVTYMYSSSYATGPRPNACHVTMEAVGNIKDVRQHFIIISHRIALDKGMTTTQPSHRGTPPIFPDSHFADWA